MINWNDDKCLITPHFTVGEALLLRKWERLAREEDGYNPQRIRETCEKAEQVRKVLGEPMIILSFFRSIHYNRDQNINPVNDVHARSIAIDFKCPTLSIDEIKERLRPRLLELRIRMEKGTSTWVHIDTKLPGLTGREFTA